MPTGRTGDININVPTTTPEAVRKEVQGLAVAVATNPDANIAFREAVTNAGLNTSTTPPPAENKQPPYLLIGGVLLISYFLFFK
jgi:hypothetical protein